MPIIVHVQKSFGRKVDNDVIYLRRGTLVTVNRPAKPKTGYDEVSRLFCWREIKIGNSLTSGYKKITTFVKENSQSVEGLYFENDLFTF